MSEAPCLTIIRPKMANTKKKGKYSIVGGISWYFIIFLEKMWFFSNVKFSTLLGVFRSILSILVDFDYFYQANAHELPTLTVFEDWKGVAYFIQIFQNRKRGAALSWRTLAVMSFHAITHSCLKPSWSSLFSPRELIVIRWCVQLRF